MSQASVAARRAAASQATAESVREPPTSAQVLAQALASLEEDKAEEVVSIPLKGRSEMADYMVIGSGRSNRHVVAIAEHLGERLKHGLGLPVRVEGKEQGDWVLIDAGDVIVHIFRPEVREFYQLEKMWAPGSAAPRAPAG